VAPRPPDEGGWCRTHRQRLVGGGGDAGVLRGVVAVNCIRIDFPIWTEGFDATLPDDFDTSTFEDPVVMSDATLWVASQPLDWTGHVVTLTELRRQGVVRPETRWSGTRTGS
jgi:hypothetical protein